MLLDPATHRAMQELSRVALSGEDIVPFGARPDRVQVYHDLIWSVFEDSLEKAFPLACAKLSHIQSWANPEKSAWFALLEAFVSAGPKTAPQLWRMPSEFVEFAIQERFGLRISAPWLDDLLRFEWMEIELYMMPDAAVPAEEKILPYAADSSLQILVNPDYKILASEFPVFRSLEESVLSARGRYFLLGFRNRQTCKVHFVELHPQMVIAVEALAEEPQTRKQLIQTLTELLPNTNGEVGDESNIRESEISSCLNELARTGMVLGVLE